MLRGSFGFAFCGGLLSAGVSQKNQLACNAGVKVRLDMSVASLVAAEEMLVNIFRKPS
jgi:hypothetical protein